MVCYGPSKGCKRCRQRKIKCDERKPDCRNCEKSKRECPGYDRGDGKVSFKHETSTSSSFANRNSTHTVDPLSSTSTSLADEFISLTTHDPTGVTKPIKFTTPNKQPRRRKSSTSIAAALRRVEEQHARDREEQAHDDDDAAGSVIAAPYPYSTHELRSPATADFNIMLVRPDSSPLIVANDYIPLGLPTDPEERSLSFFMSKFAMSADRSEEIWGGFLEALPPVLEKASMKSPLAAAASTTAMASIAWTPGGEGFREEALDKYVTSLKRINEALKDPKQATSDNLLMAVLMLGFYENIKTLTLQRSDREAHIKGAVALIKARKPGSFRSKESMRLFLAVRAQLLSLCIEKGDPTPFEDFNAATEGTLPDTFEPSSADRLVMLSEGIPHLLQREQILLEELDPQMRQEKAESLLSDALQLEELLVYWATMMPPEYQFTSIPLPSQPKLEGSYSPSTQFYPENMDIYCDNTMASTWNTWRMTRIRVLRIILHCLEITNPSHHGHGRPPEYRHAINTIYSLLNGICSSVPFHLNFHLDRVGDSSAFTCFPHPPGEARWPENFASSGAVGGWLMMQPLSFVARCEYTEASMREWVSQYLTTFLRDPRDMGRVISSPPAGSVIGSPPTGSGGSPEKGS